MEINSFDVWNASKPEQIKSNFGNLLNTEVDGTRIEQDEKYDYLGGTIVKNGTGTMKLNSRILKDKKTFHSLNNWFLGKKLVETEMKVYKSIYRPILTNGCDT